MEPQPLLRARGIVVRFGGVTALDGVDLDIAEREIYGVIGPNGAGKTTFINVVSGLSRATAGSLAFDGHGGGPWPIARAVRHGIVRTFQQTRAFLGLTVRENLEIATRSGLANAQLDELLSSWRLADVLDRMTGELPYATLRRLGIAMALALKPRLLLLDEPAVGLTAEETERLEAAIRQANAAGVTILLVEHNMRFLMRLAQRISVFDRGRVLFEGTPQQCQDHPEVIEAYLGRRRHADAGA
jgi:branched-chain amino acid transport system ATP-binding protein